jgi:hypothetical protein
LSKKRERKMPSIPEDIEALRRLMEEKFRAVDQRFDQLERSLELDRRMTASEQRLDKVESYLKPLQDHGKEARGGEQ